MADLSAIYSDWLPIEASGDWPGYPGYLNPGGLLEMVRDASHPCHGCAMEADHRVPGRTTCPTHTEAGTDPPWPAKHRAPKGFRYRAACYNHELFWFAFGFAGLALIGKLDDDENEFTTELLEAEVVDASGSTITCVSDDNPLDLLVTRYVPNPDYDGIDPEEPVRLNLGIRTRLQTGDAATLTGGQSAGNLAPRVEEVLATEWGGPGSSWQVRLNMPVGPADIGVYSDATPTVTFQREALAPETWPEFAANAPLFCARVEGAVITYQDLLDSPLAPRVELLDTGGGSCRIAIPTAPSGSRAGTFRCHKKAANGTVTDITASAIDRVRIEHIGDSGYLTALVAGADAGAGLSALLTEEGDELRVTYEPEWRSADGADKKRSPCQAICQHSKYHPVMGWACGLAGRRHLDPADDNNPANNPPDGLANYREGLEAGCYQLNTCGDFEARSRDPLAGLANFLTAIHNGYVAREEQASPGNTDPSSYRIRRPAWPSGVPGLSPMAGRVSRTPPGLHASRRPYPDEAGFAWATGSGGSRTIRRGAEIEITYGVGPRGSDLSLGEQPNQGLLANRSDGSAVDGLGRPWSDDTDPTAGARCSGALVPSCSVCDEGTEGGRGERDFQWPQSWRAFLTRLDVRSGANSLQDQPFAAARLLEDDSLLLSLKPLAEISPLGQYYDASFYAAPKVSGIVAAASVDGDFIKIEIANQAWTATYIVPDPPGPGLEVSTTFKAGGRFVALGEDHLPFDYNDFWSKEEGGSVYRGAIPGDSVTLSGAGVPDAVSGTGYYIDKARPCDGTEEAWGAGNPAPPAEWQAAPKNYADWLPKRDVIWLYDRADGVLADNLAELVGASIACRTTGIIAPTGSISIKYAAYEGAWQTPPGSQIEGIDRWFGSILLKPEFVQSLDRAKKYCFEISYNAMDRRKKRRAFHYNEIIRRQSKLDTLQIPIGNGSDGRVYTAYQREDPFSGDWGINHNDLAVIEMFPEQNFTLNGTAHDPDLTAPGSDSPLCRDGYFVADEAALSGGPQPIGPLQNKFITGIGPVNGDYRFLIRQSQLFLADYVGFGGGPLSRFAGTADNIVSASCIVRVGDITTRKTTTTFTGDGMGSIGSSTVVDYDTTGGGSYRIGLFGYKIDPASPSSAPAYTITLLGAGPSVSSTAGEWVDYDMTGPIKQWLNFRASEWVGLGFLPIPSIIGIEPDSNAAEALAGQLTDVDWTTYEPAYSGCDGGGQPVANPSVWDREGSFSSETITWEGLEMAQLVVEFGFPANFGEHMLVRNADNNHNWPPRTS